MVQLVQIKEAVAVHIALGSWPDCTHSQPRPMRRCEAGVLRSVSVPVSDWERSTMNRRGNQASGNASPTLPQSAGQNNARALQQVLDNNAEELLWVAEVMTGSRPAGEQCLAEAIALAEAAQYVGREWILSWVKRLLVHACLKQISGEIRELLPPAGPGSLGTPAGAGVNARDRQKLRSIPPQRIIASLDVLERACLILYAYLQYPVLDCALLLGCPRGWIESTCECVLAKIVGVDQSRQDRFADVDSFISPGVTECAG